MYGYEWTDSYGIYRLSINQKIEKEIRPVFKEELDYFGLNLKWEYPQTDAPLLWAEGIRKYVLNGEVVAEAKGGGFYTKPTIQVKRTDIELKPINITELWEQNQQIMLGLEQNAIDFIRSVHKTYKERGMTFAVAFSGGKDSLVLLDLVNKALPPNEFYVVFSNTGMELNCTLDAIEQAKQHWSNLRFYEAKSHLPPEKSWDEFGIPGRRMRWCCSIHKSVPTILKLREITGNYDVKVVVFDGVRAEESAQRATYDDITEGAKNINQVNCSPILKWSTSELYIYILKNGILFNSAYRNGLFRVGCKVCPMSSFWWDGIANDRYKNEMRPLLDKVEHYASLTKPQKEQHGFIEQGGWKGRMGGRGLPNGGNRVNEVIERNTIQFKFTSTTQSWLDVVVLLGPIIDKVDNIYHQLIGNKEYIFTVSNDDGICVVYSPYNQMDRHVVSHLRGIAHKIAYCIGCKACEVQCPSNAFVIDANDKILIREDGCTNCCNCIEFTHGKGCLVAKSLSITGGNNMNLKGINRYQHFGLRRSWLEHFFESKSNCFTMGQLGNRQYDSLKVWLREAGLLSTANKGEKGGSPTSIFEKLEPLGAGNPLSWAVIWANLAYNSIIVKWYMLYVPVGEVYEKNDLIFLLGDDYSQSTRDNAVTALLETLRHSPIGSVLKQGIPISSGGSYKFAKLGWETPEAIAILYSLYLWAEKTGRYNFTLSQLAGMRGNEEAVGIDPVSIFGLNPTSFKNILQDIALQFDKYIRVTFVADLDNVKLFPEFSSLDIIDIINR